MVIYTASPELASALLEMAYILDQAVNRSVDHLVCTSVRESHGVYSVIHRLMV